MREKVAQEKVIIGLSGGVDSSVAALLLLQQGYSVEGLFMKNWEQDDKNGFCAAEKDAADALAVANKLGIPLHHVNFAEEYWQRVFDNFLHEYSNGRTPNPDVLCNKEIKFKAFLDYAMNLGADWIATGHYARVVHDNDSSALFKAKDRNKDQTYFLHAVNLSALDKTLFPLAGYLKTEVREIAKLHGLITHNKKDSTGICFIGEKRFKNFLNEYLLTQPGDIVTPFGEKIGKHDGLMFYTIGQRQGLGIGGTSHGEDPWYVVNKKLASNTLVVAQGENHPLLYAQGLQCGPIHWLINDNIQYPYACYAKIRYRQQDEPCLIAKADINGYHTIIFSNPQRAITPGQSIVFYQQNQCMGGAVIEACIA